MGDVMITIHSIFNETPLKCVSIGGKRTTTLTGPLSKVCVIILGKSWGDEGLPVRLQVAKVDNLLKNGFGDVFYISSENTRSIDDVSRKLPEAKFIVPLEKANTGVLINAAISETHCDYFLLLDDGIRVHQNLASPNTIAKFIESNIFCTVPRITNPDGSEGLVNYFPEGAHGHFQIGFAGFLCDGLKTLYPKNFIGLYNRQKFIQLGGFDPNITSPYWQDVDLGCRAHLWGEDLRITTQVTLQRSEMPPIDDTTRDYSYMYFYLKNILPVYKNDHAIVKPFAAWRLWHNAGSGILEASELCKGARAWVDLNRYRFKTDIKTLIDDWGKQSR